MGYFCSSSGLSDVVQGACQRLVQFSWLRLLLRGFDRDLVLFWGAAGRKPSCQSALDRDTGGKVKANMHPCFLSLFLLNHWHWHSGKPLSGSDCFEIQNAVTYPLVFFFWCSTWERKRPGVFAWETDIDGRLSVQTIGERERDRGWNALPPYWIMSEVCSALGKGGS